MGDISWAYDRPNPNFASEPTRNVVIDEQLHSTGREIAAYAKRDPDRPAIVTTHGDVMTFGELEHDVDAIAASFAAAGLATGDVVALLCRNRPEWMVTYEAALRAGVTLLPVAGKTRAPTPGSNIIEPVVCIRIRSVVVDPL